MAIRCKVCYQVSVTITIICIRTFKICSLVHINFVITIVPSNTIINTWLCITISSLNNATYQYLAVLRCMSVLCYMTVAEQSLQLKCVKSLHFMYYGGYYSFYFTEVNIDYRKKKDCPYIFSTCPAEFYCRCLWRPGFR